jgi:hypothetical protein
MEIEPVLADTGPLIALCESKDPHHKACREQAKLLPVGKAYTCWPVLTEAAYRLRRYPAQRAKLFQAVREGVYILLPLDVEDMDNNNVKVIIYQSISDRRQPEEPRAEAIGANPYIGWHEALFTHWKQLNEWLAENRDDIRFSRRLDEVARTWDQQGRPDGGLWRPPNLDLLRQLHGRMAGEMNSLPMHFHVASDQGEKARVARERRQQRVLRSLLALAATASLLSIVMLAWALSSRRRALCDRGQRSHEWRVPTFSARQSISRDSLGLTGEDDVIPANAEAAEPAVRPRLDENALVPWCGRGPTR